MILKRDNGSTYAVVTMVVTTAWLGRGGEGRCQVVARVKSLKEPHYVPPVQEQEMKMDVMMMNEDAVPCSGTSRSNDEMNAFSCRRRMK